MPERRAPRWGAAAAAAIACGCTEYDLRQNVQTDVYTQELRNVVDVLLVVDNSCSMIEEQEKLGSNFENFIGAFADADVSYQIGVVTTDVNDTEHSGRLQGEVITPETPDPATVFADIVHVGTSGSGYESGLEAARLALSPELTEGANAGFLRTEASLSIVFVSDEEDSSPDPVDNYLDYYLAVKSPNGYEAYRDTTIMNVSAVVGPVPDGCQITAEDYYPAQPGERYIDLVTRTGGVFNSICDEDFSPLVRELGLNISGLRSEFYLTRYPDLTTLTVAVDGEVQTAGWVYLPDQNSVVFESEHVPSSQSVIEISYTVVPVGSTSSEGA